ncbi:MAG: hypothetical protein JWR15_4540 [Prosthecobacter sp.]|nr:hypothetical protein [Prosthecobacter sp.]
MKPRISVSITMLDEVNGGRHSGFTRGYAPHFVVDGCSEWLGVRALSPVVSSPVGVRFQAEFSLMFAPAVDYSALVAGALFAVHEGPKIVGTGTVLQWLPEYPVVSLYCPRCGEAMHRNADGEVYCERGQMGLSEDMEERLVSRFIERTSVSTRTTFTYGDRPQSVGGKWFCPECGRPIIERSPGVLTCDGCGQSIVDFVYHLVELHPHL